MLKALIVDDEIKNRETLDKMLSQFCPEVELVDKVNSVAAALESISFHQPDLVFLDIEMPGGNGFQLLEQLEQPGFEVVFTTAHADYAIKAIKFAALDYLLKPINIKELKAAVEKAVEKRAGGESQQNVTEKKYEVLKNNIGTDDFKFTKIALPTLDGIDFIEVDEILRCEASRSYSNFYLRDGSKIVVSKALKEFEDLLTECNFFRVHKSNMINLQYITKYVKGKGGYVVMEDGSNVDVSVRRKEDLLKKLAFQR